MILKHYYILLLLLILIVLSYSYESMKLNIIDDKIIAKEVPIYEFKSIAEDIINNNEENINDIYQLEVLYNRYIDSLRDHYLQLYTDDIKEKGYNINEIYITNKKLSIIKECKAAMSSAIPNNNDIKWNYDGTLLELINDIDQTNDELFVSLFI